MKGFVVEMAEAYPHDEDEIVVYRADFAPAVFVQTRDGAEAWARENVNPLAATFRILPGVAAPRNLSGGDYEVARAH